MMNMGANGTELEDDGAYWAQEGMKHTSQNNHAFALTCFQKAIKADFYNAGYWYSFGITAKFLGHLQEAFGAMDNACKLDLENDFYLAGKTHYKCCRKRVPGSILSIKDIITKQSKVCLAKTDCAGTVFQFVT